MFDIQTETITVVKSVTVTLDPEQVQRLVDGLPAARAIMDASMQPVLDLLEQLAALGGGLDLPTDDQRKYGRRMTGVSSAWIYDQHVKLGRTVRDIAGKLGCHRTTIDNRLRKYRRDHPELEQARVDPQPAGPSSPAPESHSGSGAG